MDALAKLSAATTALAQASTLEEVKQIMDIAEAARTYARAAKLGLEAANHAAEIKLRAERKAGELLAQLERSKGGDSRSFQPGTSVSEYNTVLTENDIAPVTAHRWQAVAKLPEPVFERHIEKTRDSGAELTTAGVLRLMPHVSHNSGENEWYTPVEYIEAARCVMGGIDVDPASSEKANEIVKARLFYSIEDDGLSQPWRGRVWMNPPYAADLVRGFASRYRDFVRDGSIEQGIVLVNNATETAWFGVLVDASCAVVFPQSRVKFWKPDGSTGAPLQGQAILYYGPNVDQFLYEFGTFGWGARW